MKITALEVDGFGVWSGLKLDGLSQGLNVFLGPNEAGKTTLMQFVRSVLYGFTSERQHYLPPLRGGRPGGSVHVAGPNGSFQVCRHRDPQAADDEVILAASDGTRQGGHLLKVLLSNIDEAIFNNVFAVGLRELQELGTLNDTEAASLLYSLSAGLDRVALVDVVKELEVSRNRLLSADGSPGQVTGLVAKREKLRAELEDLDELTHRYLRLAGQRSRLERETTRLEEEVNELQHQARVIEIAANLGDRWERRRELDEQLAALGPVETMPEGAPERLNAAIEGLKKCGRQMTQLRHDWDQIRTEAADLKVNQALWRLAPRIETLAEQEPWIATLQSRTAELETEITDLEAQTSAEQERFGLKTGAGNETLPSISAGSLRALRQPARELRQCRERLREAQQEIDTARKTSGALAAQIEAALSARGERDLAEAIDRTGSLVGQLRRCAQIDERLDQMDRYQVDLEEQSRELLRRQVLPVGVLMALGGVFMLSVMMILAGLAGLLMSESISGSFGWPLALLGLAGFSAAVATKYVLERSNARRLEGCQKQLGMIRLQINEAREERDTLTERLSAGKGERSNLPEGPDGCFAPMGPAPISCSTAEERLAELEALVPLDARRKAAEQEAEAAAERVRQAQGEMDAALERWRGALAVVGMPTKLSPKQVRSLATRCDYVRELHHRLESRYEEYEGRRRELESLTGRIAQLAADSGLTVVGDDPIEQVRLLARELGEHEARLKRREVLRGQAKQIRRKRAKLQASVRRLGYRRQEILHQVGAADEHEFRQRAAEIARAEGFRRERDLLAGEIDAAIAGHCPEEALRDELEDNRREGIEQRYEQVGKRLGASQAKLRERFEERGRLNEQLKALAEDQRPAAKRLELATVDQCLQESIHRWRVLAVASRVLRAIRTGYEQERQPETLREASGYLERMTQGRYVRVWTPLDAEVLLVDDAEGQSLPVDALSRGGREQLFLCLRLALATSLGRRGARLPLILDDVLVNFDAGRAKAAVSVLRGFAAAGHQVLVFTCHEHISKLFKSLRVAVSRLPDSAAMEGSAAAAGKPAKRRPRQKSLPEVYPHELAAQSVDPDESSQVSETRTEHALEPISNEKVPEEQSEPSEAFAPWEASEDEEAIEPFSEREKKDHGDGLVGHPDEYDDQGSYDDHGVEVGERSAARDEEEEEVEYDEEDYDEEEEDEYDEDEEYEDDYDDNPGGAEAA